MFGVREGDDVRERAQPRWEVGHDVVLKEGERKGRREMISRFSARASVEAVKGERKIRRASEEIKTQNFASFSHASSPCALASLSNNAHCSDKATLPFPIVQTNLERDAAAFFVSRKTLLGYFDI